MLRTCQSWGCRVVPPAPPRAGAGAGQDALNQQPGWGASAVRGSCTQATKYEALRDVKCEQR